MYFRHYVLFGGCWLSWDKLPAKIVTHGRFISDFLNVQGQRMLVDKECPRREYDLPSLDPIISALYRRYLLIRLVCGISPAGRIRAARVFGAGLRYALVLCGDGGILA